jgi:hypothetical protein
MRTPRKINKEIDAEEMWHKHIRFAIVGLSCAEDAKTMEDAYFFLDHAAKHIENSAEEMKKNFNLKVRV